MEFYPVRTQIFQLVAIEFFDVVPLSDHADTYSARPSENQAGMFAP